jgi:hypothetical protein
MASANRSGAIVRRMGRTHDQGAKGPKVPECVGAKVPKCQGASLVTAASTLISTRTGTFRVNRRSNRP